MAGAKLIELRSPRHGVSRIPVRPNITAVSMTVTAVQGTRQVMRYPIPPTAPIRSMCKYHALVVRPACNPLRCHPSSARALPHLRPRHRRTSHPVAAYRGGHQNSSYSRSSGSERAEPIFIAASCSQDVIRSARRDPARVSFPRGWLGSPLTLRAGLGRFQHSPLRHFSLCHVAPERD
jgi:hypothetical protein